MLRRVAKATPLQLSWKPQRILQDKEAGERLPASYEEREAIDEALILVH